MSWTNDIVLEFLDLYKREPILWEPKHPLHRNRNEVNEAWHRIQSSLSINCSILDLKRKKESLMTSFRLHYNRKKKSIDETYRISWFAYSLMESFLGGKYECDSSTNQMENELLENTSSYSNNQLIPEHNSARQSSHNSNTANRTNAPIKTRPKREKTDHAYTKRQHEDVQYIQPVEDKCTMDEYDLYGQLLAKKLRKLDEHQRDVAMHEIDNIMFRVKVQNSMPQNRTYSSESSPAPRRIKSPTQSVFIVTESGDVQYADENIPYEGHMQGHSQP